MRDCNCCGELTEVSKEIPWNHGRCKECINEGYENALNEGECIMIGSLKVKEIKNGATKKDKFTKNFLKSLHSEQLRKLHNKSIIKNRKLKMLNREKH